MPRILAFLALILPGLAYADLQVSDARIKNLPASVPVRAGYMKLYNPSSEAVSIVALRGPAFTSVAIHKTVKRDGMMSMEAIPGLEIGAGQTIQLKPGDLHLMMHPVNPTRVGEILNIVIVFDDGEELTLPMTVVK